MCIFRGSAPAPTMISQAPSPMQPINPQDTSQLPRKKELVDPDDRAGVEYATGAKASSAQAKQGIGAKALRIKVKPTQVAQAASSGGVNTSA